MNKVKKSYLINVKLSKERIGEKNLIRIDFPYNDEIIAIVRSLEGRVWDSDKKCWFLPNNKENLKKIFEAFRGKAWIDSSAIFDQKNKELQKSNASYKGVTSQYAKRVSEEQQQSVKKYKRYLIAHRYSNSTEKTYVHIVSSFLGYFPKRNPSDLDVNDVETYIHDVIVKHKYSISYQRQLIGALKLFFVIINNKNIDVSTLQRPYKEKSLPIVLSKQEIGLILKSISNVKHRTIIATIYSCGLRISEVINLKISDIDRHRMMVRIHQSKGKKDRYVGLSKMLLLMLENYYREYHPQVYLFNGQIKQQYAAESIRSILKTACKKSNILKKVSPHTLRHSYATHLIELGVNLRVVQELLGHSKPETTMIYTHVSQNLMTEVQSPFDHIFENSDDFFRDISDKNHKNIRISRQ